MMPIVAVMLGAMVGWFMHGIMTMLVFAVLFGMIGTLLDAGR